MLPYAHSVTESRLRQQTAICRDSSSSAPQSKDCLQGDDLLAQMPSLTYQRSDSAFKLMSTASTKVAVIKRTRSTGNQAFAYMAIPMYSAGRKGSV